MHQGTENEKPRRWTPSPGQFNDQKSNASGRAHDGTTPSFHWHPQCARSSRVSCSSDLTPFSLRSPMITDSTFSDTWTDSATSENSSSFATSTTRGWPSHNSRSPWPSVSPSQSTLLPRPFPTSWPFPSRSPPPAVRDVQLEPYALYLACAELAVVLPIIFGNTLIILSVIKFPRLQVSVSINLSVCVCVCACTCTCFEFQTRGC